MGKGGKREGAGRKPKIAKVLAETIAKNLFAEFGGESEAWNSLAQEARKNDLRLTFEILKYWTDRKYGKPKQSVEASGKDGGPLVVRIVHVGARA
jgi:hypothetical protein